jgi:hypothetical protein
LDDRERRKHIKAGKVLLMMLIKEAQANPKTDDPATLQRTVPLRYESSAMDTCVWCGVDPRGGRPSCARTAPCTGIPTNGLPPRMPSTGGATSGSRRRLIGTARASPV